MPFKSFRFVLLIYRVSENFITISGDQQIQIIKQIITEDNKDENQPVHSFV